MNSGTRQLKRAHRRYVIDATKKGYAALSLKRCVRSRGHAMYCVGQQGDDWEQRKGYPGI